MTWLLVGGGGVVGALLRYSLSKWIGERYFVSFPFATLLINVIGSLLLGWFTAHLGLLVPHLEPGASLLLSTGLCGAFTTFSTFSYEFTILLREGRYPTAWGYASLSVVLGLAAAALGQFGLPG